jgi:hypothetical protein
MCVHSDRKICARSAPTISANAGHAPRPRRGPPGGPRGKVYYPEVPRIALLSASNTGGRGAGAVAVSGGTQPFRHRLCATRPALPAALAPHLAATRLAAGNVRFGNEDFAMLLNSAPPLRRAFRGLPGPLAGIGVPPSAADNREP